MMKRKKEVMMMMTTPTTTTDKKGKEKKIKIVGIETIYFLQGKEKFKISHGGPTHPFYKGGWTNRLC
jgi:hypothetical protein